MTKKLARILSGRVLEVNRKDMIYKEITKWDFQREFFELRPNQFSMEALQTLYDYLEDLSETNDQDIKLDVIALCTEWTEYENEAEVLEDYDVESIEELEHRTIVLKFNHREFVDYKEVITERYLVMNY